MTMGNMLPLMMMMQSQGIGSKDAENGQSGPDMEMMMRLMMPEMFEEETEPLWSDGVPVGGARVNGIDTTGLVSLNVLPATASVDVPTIRVTVQAPIKLTRRQPIADQLKRIGDAFLRWSKDDSLAAALTEADAEAEKNEPTRNMMKVMKATE